MFLVGARYPGEWWGSQMWHMLHLQAIVFPVSDATEAQQRSVRQLYEGLEHWLPCAVCRVHWARFYAQHPVPTESRAALIDYTLLAHNHVNRMLGRPEWTLAQFHEKYTRWLLSRSTANIADRASPAIPGAKSETPDDLMSVSAASEEVVCSDWVAAAKGRQEALRQLRHAEERAASARRDSLALAITLAALLLVLVLWTWVAAALGHRRRRRQQARSTRNGANEV